MNKPARIENEETLTKFIHDVDGLHDALLHEAVLLHPGYVDQGGRMFGDVELPGARLIFQSQFADIAAVQLDMKGVSTFRLEWKLDFRLEAEIKDGAVVLYLSGRQFSPVSEIRAAEAEYTMLGAEFRGPEYKLVRGGVDFDV